MGVVAVGSRGSGERRDGRVVDNVIVVMIVVVDDNVQVVDHQVVCRRG